MASAGWMSADAARGLEARSLRARLAWRALVAHARGDETWVAAATAWRRLAGCRLTPPASSRRGLCALGSLGARSLHALGGGCCGYVSLDLGVSAVASEVTA